MGPHWFPKSKERKAGEKKVGLFSCFFFFRAGGRVASQTRKGLFEDVCLAFWAFSSFGFGLVLLSH